MCESSQFCLLFLSLVYMQSFMIPMSFLTRQHKSSTTDRNFISFGVISNVLFFSGVITHTAASHPVEPSRDVHTCVKGVCTTTESQTSEYAESLHSCCWLPCYIIYFSSRLNRQLQAGNHYYFHFRKVGEENAETYTMPLHGCKE